VQFFFGAHKKGAHWRLVRSRAGNVMIYITYGSEPRWHMNCVDQRDNHSRIQPQK
jgi:hypothetical protein